MNHVVAITTETVLDRWRELAKIENERMRIAMGLGNGQSVPRYGNGEPRKRDGAHTAARHTAHRQAVCASIVAAIEAQGGWATAAQVGAAIGRDQDSARKYLSGMVAEGAVSVRERAGRNATQWCVGGGKSQARVLAKDRILDHMRGVPERWLTIAQVAEETGVPEATASSKLSELRRAGLVEIAHGRRSGSGQRPAVWRIAEAKA